MTGLYDEIMRLLHEAGAFAETQRQKELGKAVRHAKQTADTEIFAAISCQFSDPAHLCCTDRLTDVGPVSRERLPSQFQ
ncbi:hypothetical protein [Mameliella sp.]|uniref:hypothetical protein n=1 Tax=Mameliella sp. TaxID=1924940 RepID=UPI003BA848BB